MPAKSQAQQKAAAAALAAKRSGKTPKHPTSKKMAKSMTEKELEKFARAKRKGLPKKKTNEETGWAGVSLVETYKENLDEEMIPASHAEDDDTTIASQKSEAERANSDNKKDVKNSWASVVGGPNVAVAQTNSGNPMSTNTSGAARVSAESIEPGRWQKLADMLNEQHSLETNWDNDDEPGSSLDDYEDWGDDYEDEQNNVVGGNREAQAEAEWEKTEQEKWNLQSLMMNHVKQHWNDYKTSPNSWNPEDLIMDIVETGKFDTDLPEEEMLEVAQKAIEDVQKELKSPLENEKDLEEVAPPGWEGTVKAMKDEPGIENPWALAWSMKKKGYKSHKENIEQNSLDLLFEQTNQEILFLDNNMQIEFLENPQITEKIDLVRWKQLAGILTENKSFDDENNK